LKKRERGKPFETSGGEAAERGRFLTEPKERRIYQSKTTENNPTVSGTEKNKRRKKSPQ